MPLRPLWSVLVETVAAPGKSRPTESERRNRLGRRKLRRALLDLVPRSSCSNSRGPIGKPADGACCGLARLSVLLPSTAGVAMLGVGSGAGGAARAGARPRQIATPIRPSRTPPPRTRPARPGSGPGPPAAGSPSRPGTPPPDGRGPLQRPAQDPGAGGIAEGPARFLMVSASFVSIQGPEWGDGRQRRGVPRSSAGGRARKGMAMTCAGRAAGHDCAPAGTASTPRTGPRARTL